MAVKTRSGAGLVHVDREFGARIRALRESKGWTVHELSKRSKQWQSDLSKLERGQRRVFQRPTLVRLAAALGVKGGELLSILGRNGKRSAASPELKPASPSRSRAPIVRPSQAPPTSGAGPGPDGTWSVQCTPGGRVRITIDAEVPSARRAISAVKAALDSLESERD